MTARRWVNLTSGALIATAALAALSAAAAAQDRPLDAKLKAAFVAGELKGLHNVVIIHDGDVLAESSFPGRDWRWGRPLGLRQHGAETLHDLRSVTKSIIGLLYGIALAEGKVAKPDDSIIAQFPEYPDLAGEAQRKAIRVEHALGMRMGIRWNEDVPYVDKRNSEVAMEFAKDRYRFVLGQPMAGAPGSAWVYNGGAVAVVAGLIARGVGKSIDKYAEEKLFKPLGITRYDWIKGRDGTPSAASGLRLSARDLAKIGKLVLQNGRFNGRRVVPAAWLAQSFAPRSTTRSGLRYGYLWWLAPESMGAAPSWVAGFGNGGQRLTVQAEYKLIVVVFAGNYNRKTAWQLPVKIITKFVAPAVRARIKK